MYLIDSDYIIDFIKGKENAVGLINLLAKRGISTSVICVCEVLEGIYFTENLKKAGLKEFTEFLKSLKIIGVDFLVASQFASIRGRLRLKGQLIDNFDLLIASTCIVNNLTLVTDNKKHFDRIPRLNIYEYEN